MAGRQIKKNLPSNGRQVVVLYESTKTYLQTLFFLTKSPTELYLLFASHLEEEGLLPFNLKIWPALLIANAT
jgi:hypothetical protein